jgi:hypothetical protein
MIRLHVTGYYGLDMRPQADRAHWHRLMGYRTEAIAATPYEERMRARNAHPTAWQAPTGWQLPPFLRKQAD